jgi:NDP-sugar pyrophosphorylase family protein
MRLKGWKDNSTGEIKWAGSPVKNVIQLAFSGIHILNPQIFRLMQPEEKFSIIDTYLSLAAAYPIIGSLEEGVAWFDLGRPAQLEIAADFIRDHPEMLPGL